MQSTITLDSTAPTVRSVTPRYGATASATTSVEAIFSEAIDPATLSARTVILVRAGANKPLLATVSYDPATRKMILKPRQNLFSGATYTVTITGGAAGIKDLAGNALAASKVWRFKVS